MFIPSVGSRETTTLDIHQYAAMSGILLIVITPELNATNVRTDSTFLYPKR